MASEPDFSKVSLDFSPILAVDRSYGFLGIKLGTPLAMLPQMVFSEEREGGYVYKNPSDALKVGSALVSYIEYYFKQSRLAYIFIGFKTEAEGTKLRNSFSRVYGRGYGTDKLVFWRGEETDVIYTVQEGGSGFLSIGFA